MRFASNPDLVLSLAAALFTIACADDRGAISSDATDGGDSGTETAPSDSGEGPKLDLFGDADAGENIGDCGASGGAEDGDEAFSIIWIANSSEGTVSKIDTTTAIELARYATGPGPENPDPSRTSVNLFGDVAIANRSGSVVKIAANLDNCIDTNLDGEITTSQGSEDVLDWGNDECVLWHHDVGFDNGGGNPGGPRAVAWDAGEPGPDGCPKDPKLWVGWRNQPDAAVKIRRLDGETGELLGEVDVLGWQQNWGHGTYGGATDKDRDFWGLGTNGTLVRVDAETLEVTRWDNPESGRVVYGIALDQLGDPWLGGYDGSLWRFDVAAQTWEDRGQVGEPSQLRGLAIDKDGHAWIAGNGPCGLIRYDTLANQTVAAQIELPDCQEPVGVSIDSGGFVWVVDRGANMAYKIDPDTQTVVATVAGLVDPYTYSDMTGAGLDVVVNPGIG
jgi:DNA-binding beta-propeller fold protein YncE